jgi:6-phosphogluconolactonase
VSQVEVLRHPDAEALADAVAARLMTRLVERITDAGSAHLCLTGGGIGTAVLAAIAANPARDSVDWPLVDVWWGDERYLPEGYADRNETSAREALLNHVPVRADRVHAIPGPWGSHSDVDEAAEAYARALAAAARPEDHGPTPSMDVLLLGIGPDAHVASLFPGQPAVHEARPVVAVRGAPKPPPVRVTLTLPTINAAREVWILASGAEKAGAVRLALSEGAGPFQVPAAGARGRDRTLFLLDEPAARKLPPGLGRPAA